MSVSGLGKYNGRRCSSLFVMVVRPSGVILRSIRDLESLLIGDKSKILVSK